MIASVRIFRYRSRPSDASLRALAPLLRAGSGVCPGDGSVYVDGEILEEGYIKEQMLPPSYGEGLNHVTVPEGCIFVMGDNRNHSADSRYPAIGIVDVRCVIGRGAVVLFPFHHWKGL